MSTESIKARHERLFTEAINNGDLAVADELVHPDYVNHDMAAPLPGREGWKQTISMFRAGFPDLTVVVESRIAEADQVASYGMFTGTHTGVFMGIPATGTSVTVRYIDIWRVEQGLFKENWLQMDMAGLLQALTSAA